MASSPCVREKDRRRARGGEKGGEKRGVSLIQQPRANYGPRKTLTSEKGEGRWGREVHQNT